MSKICGHYELARRAIAELKLIYPMDVLILDFAVAPGFGGITTSELGLGAGMTPWGYKMRTAVNTPAAGGYLSFCGAENADSMCTDVRDPAAGSVCQDLADTYACKHTSDKPEDQAAHFMRASGQHVSDAYRNSTNLIRTEAQLAARQLSQNLFKFDDWAAWGGPQSGFLTAGRASMHLGRALHAVQDSFSPSHATRLGGSPGAIAELMSYVSQDKKNHAAGDMAWYDSSNGSFSSLGRFAIDAGKELIRMTLRLVEPVSWLNVPYLRNGPTWDSFREKWLGFTPRQSSFR